MIEPFIHIITVTYVAFPPLCIQSVDIGVTGEALLEWIAS